VAGGGEHAHVGADLGDDRLGGPLAHPGDGGQPVLARANGAITRSTSVSRVAIEASSCSKCSRARRTSNP
jgi:hypothetical protein